MICIMRSGMVVCLFEPGRCQGKGEFFPGPSGAGRNLLVENLEIKLRTMQNGKEVVS
jgi:hypothetical protein